MHKPNLIVVCGPTASGKTSLAIRLAENFDTEVISADSRQFYREMSVGTAKPSEEELRKVPHHFINTLSVTDNYSVGDYEKEVLLFLDNYYSNKSVAVLAGGSGLYIDAVLKGFDLFPEPGKNVREKLNDDYKNFGLDALKTELREADPLYYQEVDLHNPQRIIRALEVFRSSGSTYSSFRLKEKKERFFNVVKIGIAHDREVLYGRINQRVDEMMKNGLLEEVKSLMGFRELNALQTVGYQELFDYLDGKTSLDKAVDLIKQNTRRYAKRQLTWFRRDPEIRWFDNSSLERAEEYITLRLAGK